MNSGKNKGVENKAFDGSALDLESPDNHNSSVENKDNEKATDDISDPDRPTWGNSTEFLMSCISMSVGLGNVWRFPFTAYENGGGAFLIPYIIILILIGKPIYYLEMICGQFTSRASIKVWEVVPAMKGIAFGQLVGTASVLSYYASLIALTLLYMIRSFAAELPWAKCWSSWPENCINASSLEPVTDRPPGASSSSELYFLKEVIKEKKNIDDGLGTPDWELCLWLLLAWFLIFLVIVKGVKSSGKVAWFTALFPYAVLIILLIRAATLDGAVDGIVYFIKPDFERILEPQVWYQAVTQLFFSLSVGIGNVMMFASYNRFDHNIYRDALIVTSIDTFTSLLAGFTIFGILGNLAYNIGETDMSKVISSGGSGLAFISYPEAIAKFQVVPQLFAVIFFFMLFVLGIGSAVALHSTVITNVMDHLPVGKFKYWQIAGIASTCGFLIGIAYVTPGGQWVLTLVDHFGATFLVFALAILQLVAIFWVYGLQNFCWDAEFMLGRKVTLFWKVSWAIVTPGIMIIIFIYNMANLQDPTYGSRKFPNDYIIAGWIIFTIGISQVLIWGIWVVGNNYQKMIDPHDRFISSIKKSFTASEKWGPKNPKQKEEWMRVKKEAFERRRIQIVRENHSWFKQTLYLFSDKYQLY